jgi:glutathione synthase/RimK-type ligase-like ATP-grasp enzyme
MDEGIANFCRQETRATVIGSIIGRPARWMSEPDAVWRAEFKPFQLDLAARLGLAIPRTVITNDPKVIRDAFREFENMVVKPSRTGHVVSEGIEYAIYTSRVLEQHLEDLESARFSPAIYQELINKRYDVRVTIVGNRCFGAAIDSQSDPAATIDWRQTENPKLPHSPIEIPKQLEDALLALMKSLQLSFGAIDLVQTPSGEYVFLEVNPSGQWLWIDDMLGLGISDSIVDWLAEPHAE